MPLPGKSNPTGQAEETPTLGPRKPAAKVTLDTKPSKIFELPPAGLQPAVLAEIVSIEVDEPERDKNNNVILPERMKPVQKLVFNFELEATYTDPEGDFYGKRCIVTQDYYPAFRVSRNKPTKLVKVSQKWAGSQKFSADDLAEWEQAISAAVDADSRSGAGLLGATCTLNIVHATSKKGFDYACIGSNGEDVSPPLGGKEKLPISADYTPYWERQAFFAKRKAEREAQQSSFPPPDPPNRPQPAQTGKPKPNF